MKPYRFSIHMQVRDYECDFQGIVNNAVYLNYLEHTRHEFAKSLGFDVVSLAARGINLVIVRAEIDYKASLRSGDAFMVALNTERLSRLRFVFDQEIYRINSDQLSVLGDQYHPSPPKGGRSKDVEDSNYSSDRQLILRARMTATAVNEKGRPFLTKELDPLFTDEG